MQMVRTRVPRTGATIAVTIVVLAIAGLGAGQGSARPSANAAKAKKSHALDAEWKTGPLDVIGEGERGVDLEGTDEAKLVGRPIGKGKARLDEEYRFTYVHQGEIPRHDYSGTFHFSFDADVIKRGRFVGTFSGFYDYSVDSEGEPSSAPSGRITGGSRAFRGATGSFTIQDFHTTSNDPVKHAGRWRGSIRY